MGAILGLRLQHNKPWKKVNGMVISNYYNSESNSDLSLSSFKIEWNNIQQFNRIRGSLYYNEFGKAINLNGVNNKGVAVPYVSTIYDRGMNLIVKFEISRKVDHSTNVIEITFNIGNMNKEDFNFNIWVQNDKNTNKNTKPQANVISKKTIPWTVITTKNKYKQVNFSKNDGIYTSNYQRSGPLLTNCNQLGFCPDFLSASFSTDLGRFGAARNYMIWNNIWDGYSVWWTSYSYHISEDYEVDVNLKNTPIIFNYNQENNKNSENILDNSFSSSVYVWGADHHNWWERTLSRFGLPSEFSATVESWFAKNENFKIGTNKTLKNNWYSFKYFCLYRYAYWFVTRTTTIFLNTKNF